MEIVNARMVAGETRPRLWVLMATGHGFFVDIDSISGLASRLPDNLKSVIVSDGTLEWREPNLRITLIELIELVLGPVGLEATLSPIAARAFGRRGGRVRSDAKAKASKKNGKKGGRPPNNSNR